MRFFVPLNPSNSAVAVRYHEECNVAMAGGIVAIASAYRTEDPGFESRQGVRF
jgi:hypothetical protein